jgi:hypothetical protein
VNVVSKHPLKEKQIMKRCCVLIIVAITVAACAGAAPAPSTPPASLMRTPAVSPVEIPAQSPVATPVAPSDQSGTSPTATSGRVAVFPETIIVYQRTGGFAGTSDKWTIYQTGRIVAGDGAEWQVPAEQVAPLFKLVEAPDFASLSAKYAPAGTCNDCFTHTLMVYGPGEPQSVTFVDGADLPPYLQQLLPELNKAIAR